MPIQTVSCWGLKVIETKGRVRVVVPSYLIHEAVFKEILDGYNLEKIIRGDALVIRDAGPLDVFLPFYEETPRQPVSQGKDERLHKRFPEP